MFVDGRYINTRIQYNSLEVLGSAVVRVLDSCHVVRGLNFPEQRSGLRFLGSKLSYSEFADCTLSVGR